MPNWLNRTFRPHESFRSYCRCRLSPDQPPAFSRFDDPDVTEKPVTGATASAAASGRKDMVDVLKLSLDKERESREQLNEQLRQAQAQLQGREKVLGDRESLMREAEQLLRQKADESARLAKERAALQQQVASAQTGVSELQKQLANSLQQASESRQHLEAVRNDLETREQEEAILKRKLAELEKSRLAAEASRQAAEASRLAAEKSRLAAEAEKQQLAAQLQVAETEKRLVKEQLDTTQGEVLVERQEKAKLQEHTVQLQEHANKLQEHATKLAEGVTVLAEKSGEPTQEIRENRPLAPNTVFNEFVTNRVRFFRAVRSGVFGREINGKSILVRQREPGLRHLPCQRYSLELSFPGVDSDRLIGDLRRGAAVVRIDRISFLGADPRIVVVPVPEAKAHELGSKVYSLPKEPFKFQEAILVGANEGYYGECRFQMDADNPGYVHMQRERFSWLVGKFAPSSGDLVFTKSGELLGVMVNKDYCLLLTTFSPAYHIQMGIGIGEQQTGTLLAQFYGQVARMPLKLQ